MLKILHLYWEEFILKTISLVSITIKSCVRHTKELSNSHTKFSSQQLSIDGWPWLPDSYYMIRENYSVDSITGTLQTVFQL